MKKKLFSLLFIGMVFASFKSNAIWSYCQYAVLVGPSSWNLYINKAWSGGQNQLFTHVQYRYSLYTPSSGTWTITTWQDLPPSGFIGNSSANGGINNIEIREILFWTETGPVFGRQLYVGPC
ncbi:hypothetical protein DBR32_03520 [Taibaiella sp. KBW10]|uniref:hypothetical protein n=1 Tax=Taibaiella sp. KBW10 TaxID=2153357 RepID=UPI000F5AC1D8|nr:hypothetical protein [Taibaiella sp. KBW10]RQO31886.1 hypothetical protein DBR32_03520 [Taibaiella sp. KBW10]